MRLEHRSAVASLNFGPVRLAVSLCCSACPMLARKLTPARVLLAETEAFALAKTEAFAGLCCVRRSMREKEGAAFDHELQCRAAASRPKSYHSGRWLTSPELMHCRAALIRQRRQAAPWEARHARYLNLRLLRTTSVAVGGGGVAGRTGAGGSDAGGREAHRDLAADPPEVVVDDVTSNVGGADICFAGTASGGGDGSGRPRRDLPASAAPEAGGTGRRRAAERRLGCDDAMGDPGLTTTTHGARPAVSRKSFPWKGGARALRRRWSPVPKPSASARRQASCRRPAAAIRVPTSRAAWRPSRPSLDWGPKGLLTPAEVQQVSIWLTKPPAAGSVWKNLRTLKMPANAVSR